MNDNQKPLGIKEAMDFTGYTRSYLYKLIYDKKIPCHKPGGKKGRIFFARSELVEFVNRGKQYADYEIAEKADAVLNREA